MKIALIQPPKPTHGVQAEEHWDLTRPFSLLFLASALEKYTQHSVHLVDLEHKKYRSVPLEDVFEGDDSDIFGITATTYTRFEAIKIARTIKNKIAADSLVVVGGVHFMSCAEDTLERIPEIDVVVRGEGERTIVQLANALSDGTSFEEVKGITWRRDGEVIRNPNQELFEDLDDIPLYTKFTWDEYPEYLFGSPDRIRAISIMSSRGCPYSCVFCSKAGMKYRLRDPRKVVDEIEFLKEKFDIEGINFLDLTFTADPRHVKAVCQEMIDRKINLKWWCESRVNIQLDLLDLMKQAGCVSLVIGVESGSPRILSRIAKNITVELVVEFCRKCSEIGIGVGAYFMCSHPDETEDDLRHTLALIDRLEGSITSYALQPTMIFPGAELERIARDKGILPTTFSWCDPYDSDVNRACNQLVNVPLYIDRLSPEVLAKVLSERLLKKRVDKAARLSVAELLSNALDVIVHRKPALQCLFSPRFYRDFVAAKVTSTRGSRE